MQGWRLDPLLLFCQLLTAGTALGFALEALGLRQQMQANPVRSTCLTVPVNWTPSAVCLAGTLFLLVVLATDIWVLGYLWARFSAA